MKVVENFYALRRRGKQGANVENEIKRMSMGQEASADSQEKTRHRT